MYRRKIIKSGVYTYFLPLRGGLNFAITAKIINFAS